MWTLCVVLGSLHIQKECWPVPTEIACVQQMREWVNHGHAWSERSGARR